MGVELATAWVSLVPSTRGIAAQVRKEVGSPLENIATQAGQRAGRGFGSNLVANAVSGLDRLGERITSTIVTGVKIGAAAAAGILAGSLAGGLGRVLATEDATIAFQQMGLSIQEIDQALEGVDRTFQGTPFANPTGFNITAQLLASGRGLEQVEEDLLNIANVTSQTLDKDLERTSQTFLKISATGRAYAEDLNSIALQGIPIKSILADALDVTGDELNDMVSEGEITFDTLMDVIGATERFDGAAQAVGRSTRGAFQNVLTGLARVGESFIGPLFGQDGHVVTALQAIREGLFTLTPIADRLGERFADWLIPQIQRLSQWVTETLIPALTDGAQWFSDNREAIVKVAQAVGPAIVALGGLATAVHLVRTAIALTPVGIVLTLVSALIYAWQNSETFRDVVTGVFERVQGIVGTVVETVTGWVRGFADLFSGSGEPSQRMTQFQEHADSIWESITSIFDAALTLISVLIENTTTYIRIVWGMWGDEMRAIFRSTWDTIAAIAGLVFDQIILIIDTALQIVAGIIDVIVGYITMDWERSWEGVKTIFSAVWGLIRDTARNWMTAIRRLLGDRIDALIEWWKKLPGRTIDAISGLITRGREWAVGVVARMLAGFVVKVAEMIVWWRDLPGRVIGAVASLQERARQWAVGVVARMLAGFVVKVAEMIVWWRDLPGRVIGAIANLQDRASLWAVGVVARMLSGATAKAADLFDWWRGLPGRILDALGDLSGLLIGAGKALIQGLIDGIVAVAGSAVSAVRDKVVTPIRNLMPGSPAKEGPLSGRGWVFYGGRSIPEALAEGIVDRAGAVRSATAQLASMAQGGFDLTPGRVPTVRAAEVGSDGAAMGGRHYHLHSTNHVDRPMDERKLVKQLDRMSRLHD